MNLYCDEETRQEHDYALYDFTKGPSAMGGVAPMGQIPQNHGMPPAGVPGAVPGAYPQPYGAVPGAVPGAVGGRPGAYQAGAVPGAQPMRPGYSQPQAGATPMR